jgi:hypothetical protein
LPTGATPHCIDFILTADGVKTEIAAVIFGDREPLAGGYVSDHVGLRASLSISGPPVRRWLASAKDAGRRETTMRYLCLLVGEPMLSDYQSATQAMAAAGVLVDSGPLQPPAAARTIRVREHETLVADGPFTETKEQIGGYYVLDCAGFDEATRWAATIPAAWYGAIEIRPLMVLGSHEE